MNFYDDLGVKPDATPAQIKRAYRVLAKKFHPDRNSGNAEDMKRISIAYETLSDPIKREFYDKTGRGRPAGVDDKARKTVVDLATQYVKTMDLEVDLVAWIKAQLEGQRQTVMQGLAHGQKVLARLERTLRRLSRANDDGSADPIAEMIRDQISNVSKGMGTIDVDLERITAADRFIENYRFEPDFETTYPTGAFGFGRRPVRFLVNGVR